MASLHEAKPKPSYPKPIRVEAEASPDEIARRARVVAEFGGLIVEALAQCLSPRASIDVAADRLALEFDVEDWTEGR